MPTQTHTASRRDILKASGAVAVVAALGVSPTINRVAATDSGDPELTTTASIPSDTAVEITIDEYETADASTPLYSQIIDLSDGESTAILDTLEGNHDYRYAFEVQLGTNGSDVSVDALTLDIPSSESFESVSYDASSWDAKPDDVQIVYDEQRLWKFQPKVKLSQQLRENTDGMYGFIAESDSQDTFVCCYWLLLPKGETPTFANPNSALGGHVPIYVFVDEATGEVDRVVYASWQWMASDLDSSEAALTQDRANYPTHACFEAVAPYNVLNHLENWRWTLYRSQITP